MSQEMLLLSEKVDGDQPDGGLKIITGSIFRMGTKSLSEALKILDYKPHHGLDDKHRIPWAQLEDAADGKWPEGAGPLRRRRAKYTRREWDDMWRGYDAVTDMASPFAADLAVLYPEAKVIVIQRDFYTWWPSFLETNLGWRFFPGSEALNATLGFFNMRAGHVVKKLYFGMFNARSIDEVRANARRGYDSYFEEIRRVVPEPSRRLEYKLGSGWGPLCEFLGKEVPDVPFPNVNDRAALRAWMLDAIVDAIVGTLVQPALNMLVIIAGLYSGWIFFTHMCLDDSTGASTSA